MKKRTGKSVVFTVLLVLLSLAFFSCSRKEGYSAVLWGLPEYHIQDGDIVTVYSKSNKREKISTCGLLYAGL